MSDIFYIEEVCLVRHKPPLENEHNAFMQLSRERGREGGVGGGRGEGEEEVEEEEETSRTNKT